MPCVPYVHLPHEVITVKKYTLQQKKIPGTDFGRSLKCARVFIIIDCAYSVSISLLYVRYINLCQEVHTKENYTVPTKKRS